MLDTHEKNCLFHQTFQNLVMFSNEEMKLGHNEHDMACGILE